MTFLGSGAQLEGDRNSLEPGHAGLVPSSDSKCRIVWIGAHESPE